MGSIILAALVATIITAVLFDQTMPTKTRIGMAFIVCIAAAAAGA